MTSWLLRKLIYVLDTAGFIRWSWKLTGYLLKREANQ